MCYGAVNAKMGNLFEYYQHPSPPTQFSFESVRVLLQKWTPLTHFKLRESLLLCESLLLRESLLLLDFEGMAH